jgi:Tfp pilus assembly protein PilX
MHKTTSTQQQGFILPITVMLLFVLSISGMTFLQLDFLEKRAGTNEFSYHAAFQLANAGIERARVTFKVPDSFEWDAV